ERAGDGIDHGPGLLRCRRRVQIMPGFARAGDETGEIRPQIRKGERYGAHPETPSRASTAVPSILSRSSSLPIAVKASAMKARISSRRAASGGIPRLAM